MLIRFMNQQNTFFETGFIEWLKFKNIWLL
jgi:hypothetical protein